MHNKLKLSGYESACDQCNGVNENRPVDLHCYLVYSFDHKLRIETASEKLFYFIQIISTYCQLTSPFLVKWKKKFLNFCPERSLSSLVNANFITWQPRNPEGTMQGRGPKPKPIHQTISWFSFPRENFCKKIRFCGSSFAQRQTEIRKLWQATNLPTVLQNP